MLLWCVGMVYVREVMVCCYGVCQRDDGVLLWCMSER